MTFSIHKIHEQIDAWLDAAAGGGLAPDETRALEAHLQTCPDCLRAQREYRLMSERLTETLEKKKPQPGFEERLVAGFRRGRAVEPRRTAPLASLAAWLGRALHVRLVQYGGALAGLAALVMTGALLTQEPTSERQPNFGLNAFKLALNRSLSTQNEFSAGYRPGLQYDATTPDAPAPTSAPSQDLKRVVPDQGVYVERRKDGPVSSAQEEKKQLTLGYNGAPGEYMAIQKSPNSNITYGNQFQHMAPTYKVNDVVDVKGGLMGDAASVQAAASSTLSSADKGLPQNSPRVASAPIDAQTMAKNAVSTDGNLKNPEIPAAAPMATATPDTRKVIRNGHVEFEVEKFDAAVDVIDAAAKAEGGFLDTKTSARGANGKVSGTVVARVLPDHLDAFLARIAGLGTLKTQRIEAEDITKAYTDTDARLRNARKMEEQLLGLLEKNNGKVTDLLKVEEELGRVRSGIEEMQAELKVFDSQLAYSTVTIALAEKDLSQAATFVVKESAEVALLASDVDKAFQAATDAVKSADGQIEESRLTRDEAGRVQGTLRFLVAPEKADALIGQVQGLGRVARFNKTDRQIAQGGNQPSDTATVKRDKVEVAVSLSHDEETRQVVTLRVVAKDVAGLLAKAKAAAASRQGEVLNSEMSQGTDGNASAHLVVRVPADGFAALQDDFKALGRVASIQAQRQDNGAPSPDADRAPVLLDLTLADEEEPVQTTEIRVLTPEVEARAAALKKAAVAAGAEVRNSTFNRTADAEESAELVFRLPLDRSKALLDQIRAAGKVESFAEQRRDRPGAAAPEEGGPVEISLVLHNPGAAIADENGLGATLRRTLGQGAAALTWSLRMIGVAIAFLAPWLLIVAAGAGGVLWFRRRAKK